MWKLPCQACVPVDKPKSSGAGLMPTTTAALARHRVGNVPTVCHRSLADPTHGSRRRLLDLPAWPCPGRPRAGDCVSLRLLWLGDTASVTTY